MRGAGAFVSASGLIKTSFSIAELGRLLNKIFPLGQSRTARLVMPPIRDLALLMVEARTTLATKSYDFDEARLRSRNAAVALEASHAAFAALSAENDRLRTSRHHHSK